MSGEGGRGAALEPGRESEGLEDDDEFEDAQDWLVADGAAALVTESSSHGIPGDLGTVARDGSALVEQNNDDDVYVDAEEDVSVLATRLDKDLDKAFETFLSFKGASALSAVELQKMYSSRKVHLGNIKYDLRKVNLQQQLDALWRHLEVKDVGDNQQSANGELKIVTRREWKAEPAMDILTPLKRPVPMVIVCHTAGLMAYTQAENCHIIQRIQAFHTESLEWDDIGYNFLVGMDGLIYEGRGWLSVGAHTRGYNFCSIAVAFVGRFTRFVPTNDAMQAFHKLVARGVELGHLAQDYKLFAACQLVKTESPGKSFSDVIREWPHWAAAP